MNYLAKMQLKSSKAVLVLRHRAAPHNVLGQATWLHRGADRSCHELPTFRETSFWKSRIILRATPRRRDNFHKIFTRQIAPDHQYTWALIYVAYLLTSAAHPVSNPRRWKMRNFGESTVPNFKIIYGCNLEVTVQTNNLSLGYFV